jgi:hypothetical protein
MQHVIDMLTKEISVNLKRTKTELVAKLPEMVVKAFGDEDDGVEEECDDESLKTSDDEGSM